MDTSLAAANPESAPVQALVMLRQVMEHAAEAVRNRDLRSVHLEDVLVRSAMQALRETEKSLPLPSQEGFRKELDDFARQLGELHYYSDLKKQTETERQLLVVMQGLGRIQAYFPEPTVRAASALAERYHCPRHPEATGRRTDLCAFCGQELLQQVRLIPGRTNAPGPQAQTVRALIRTEHPLAAGQETAATLALSRFDGTPVFPDDLVGMHGRRVHLFLVDGGLADFHHLFPEPTTKPGEFAFRFTPRSPGSYFAWAEIRPAPLGLVEYAATRIAARGRGEPATNRTITTRAVIDGLAFELSFGGRPLRAKEPAPLRLSVTSADGSGFAGLEPLAGAFAHCVGIGEDRETAFRFTPRGRPVINQRARGGPDLDFVFHSPRSGFVRLFCTVQIEGRPRTASFGFQVEP